MYKVHNLGSSNFEASVALPAVRQVNKYVNLWTCTHTSILIAEYRALQQLRHQSVSWLLTRWGVRNTYGNESLHQDSDDNGVRIIDVTTSKDLALKSTVFPHREIHKYTWTSTDGKTHNQIDHILIDRRWHSSILDVRSFRGADCDTHHYLMVAKVRERLAVSKQAAQRFDGEGFNLRKLNELEVKKQY